MLAITNMLRRSVGDERVMQTEVGTWCTSGHAMLRSNIISQSKLIHSGAVASDYEVCFFRTVLPIASWTYLCFEKVKKVGEEWGGED